MEYNKLVRDNIPEIIKKKNKIPITHTANNEEYFNKLKEKLTEEVNEFLENNSEEELADILEVIESICEFKNIDKDKLEVLKISKARERGKFTKRIILEKVD